MKTKKTKVIRVTHGTGEGITTLSAFDGALNDAGIANFNLIPLSSIIPNGHVVKIEKVDLNDEDYGNRLYVVLAHQREHVIGKEAWAGLGWAMVDDDKNPRGILVEHEGSSKKEVVKLIEESLACMIENRKEKFKPIEYKVAGVTCKSRPVCALVAAIFKSEDWE